MGYFSRNWLEVPFRLNRREACRAVGQLLLMTNRSPFRYYKTSTEFMRLAVILYVCFPLSLRNADDLLNERCFNVS